MIEGMATWGNNIRMPLETYEELGGDEKFSAYYFFEIYKSEFLTCNECVTLQTCYPLQSIQAFYIITWKPTIKMAPLTATMGHWAVLTSGNLHILRLALVLFNCPLSVKILIRPVNLINFPLQLCFKFAIFLSSG
jgi:hypothetical protein